MLSRLASTSCKSLTSMRAPQRMVASSLKATSVRAFSASASSSAAAQPFDWKSYFETFETDPGAVADYNKLPTDAKKRLEEMTNDNMLELENYFSPLFGKVKDLEQNTAIARARIEEIERLVRSTTDVKPIDFDSYRSKIKDKSAVDALEREYHKIKLPVYKFPTAPYQPHVDLVIKKSVEMRDENTKIADELREKINKMREQRARLRVTTYDEILAEHPEWREEILARIEHPDYELYTVLRSSVNEEISAIKEYKDDHHHHH